MIQRYFVLLIQSLYLQQGNSHSSFVAQIGFINYPNYPIESNLAVPHPILGAILAHSGKTIGHQHARKTGCLLARSWKEGTSQTLHSSPLQPTTTTTHSRFTPQGNAIHDRHHTASTASRLIIDTFYGRYNFYF